VEATEIEVVTTLVKNPCNKINKGKIITKVMGHVFQAKCWEKHSDVDHL